MNKRMNNTYSPGRNVKNKNKNRMSHLAWIREFGENVFLF